MASSESAVALTDTRVEKVVFDPRYGRPVFVQVTFIDVSGTGSVVVDMVSRVGETPTSLDDGNDSDTATLTNGAATQPGVIFTDGRPYAIGLTPTGITSCTALVYCEYGLLQS